MNPEEIIAIVCIFNIWKLYLYIEEFTFKTLLGSLFCADFLQIHLIISLAISQKQKHSVKKLRCLLTYLIPFPYVKVKYVIFLLTRVYVDKVLRMRQDEHAI